MICASDSLDSPVGEPLPHGANRMPWSAISPDSMPCNPYLLWLRMCGICLTHYMRLKPVNSYHKARYQKLANTLVLGVCNARVWRLTRSQAPAGTPVCPVFGFRGSPLSVGLKFSHEILQQFRVLEMPGRRSIFAYGAGLFCTQTVSV